MKTKLIIFVIFANFCTFFADNIATDHYWRDFYGRIPDDAYTYYTNASGFSFYVGQIYVSSSKELLPANIISKNKIDGVTIYNENQESTSLSDNIKILCGSHNLLPFQWTPIENNNLNSIDENFKLIPAGKDGNRNYYFGKTISNNQPSLSKVFRDDTNKGLWFMLVGKAVMKLSSFHILGYKNHNIINLLDVRSNVD